MQKNDYGVQVSASQQPTDVQDIEVDEPKPAEPELLPEETEEVIEVRDFFGRITKKTIKKQIVSISTRL